MNVLARAGVCWLVLACFSMTLSADMKLLLKLFKCFLITLCIYSINALSSFRTASYSTKTPYFWVNDEKENIALDSETWFEHEDKTCQVVHLNAVLRHGARFPSLKWIKRMTVLHKKLTENGVDEQFPFLKTWTNPFPEESDKIIAELGQQEHEMLGERFAHRFNLLFDEDMDSIRIVTSSKQRSYASSLAFYTGLSQTVLGGVILKQASTSQHTPARASTFIFGCFLDFFASEY